MPDTNTGSAGRPDEPHDPRDPRDDQTPKPGAGEPDEHPRGTLFLMLVFLMVLMALWGYVYFDMIQGGS
jgi:hypothetical protein